MKETVTHIATAVAKMLQRKQSPEELEHALNVTFIYIYIYIY